MRLSESWSSASLAIELLGLCWQMLQGSKASWLECLPPGAIDLLKQGCQGHTVRREAQYELMPAQLNRL